MVHENNIKLTVSVCWCPNKLADGINSSAFTPYYTIDISYRKKTANMFFLIVLYTLYTLSFAVINARGLYLRFAAEE